MLFRRQALLLAPPPKTCRRSLRLLPLREAKQKLPPKWKRLKLLLLFRLLAPNMSSRDTGNRSIHNQRASIGRLLEILRSEPVSGFAMRLMRSDRAILDRITRPSLHT